MTTRILRRPDLIDEEPEREPEESPRTRTISRLDPITGRCTKVKINVGELRKGRWQFYENDGSLIDPS